MNGKGLMNYFGAVVEKTGDLIMPVKTDDNQKSTSSTVVSFLTKTAIWGGIIASSYYIGKDSTKPNGVVSKILGRTRENKAKAEGCVLHGYDHCPKSIQVELALAFLGVPYVRMLYGFSDVEGPKWKTNLPVLEWLSSHTPDPLDIIDMLEKSTPHRSIPPRTDREDLDQWLEETKKVRQDLSRPRVIKMPVKDWADQRDERYAWRKYEKKGGFNYKNALARTADLLVEINLALETFNDKILFDEFSVNKFGIGMDDLLVLPHLRTLTCVKGIKWPKKLRRYLENSFEETIAGLYFNHAV